MDEKRTLHIAMYPWFAMGHIIPYLHLSHKLAERGHKISFFLPIKIEHKLHPFNHFPNLITFISIDVPHLDGVPAGAETTADVPFHLHPLLMTAMDRTQPAITAHLRSIKPDFVFFDFTHWLPAVSRQLEIKTVLYCIVSPATIGYLISPERKLLEKCLSETDLMDPPPSFPTTTIKLYEHEARGLAAITKKVYGSNVVFAERLLISFGECDAIGFKTSKEMEGPYCQYIQNQFEKPVILAGPVVPEPPCTALHEDVANILNKFEAEKLVFCAFGSESILKIDQFHELVLGLELTGLPFLAALKPPIGFERIESALPLGFEERVKERGFVRGDWVQQQLILSHHSVGCFVTHCGSGSLSEAMVNECQLVLLPHLGDQVINARLMSRDLGVGVEVEKGKENGMFTRHGVCTAIKDAMDDDSEVAKQLKRNHKKWRRFLLTKRLENSYVDDFVQGLRALFE